MEIRGLGRSRRLRLAGGAPLLEAALAAGLAAPHRCREARCGRCRVTVAAGSELLEAPGERERLRLGAALESGQRLLCQATAAPDAQSGVLVLQY